MAVKRDWEQYERDVRQALLETARSELVADRARGAARTGECIAELRGTYPETEVFIRGPGVKSGQPHEWHFAIYEHWGFDPDRIPEPHTLAGLMWTDMDD